MALVDCHLLNKPSNTVDLTRHRKSTFHLVIENETISAPNKHLTSNPNSLSSNPNSSANSVATTQKPDATSNGLFNRTIPTVGKASFASNPPFLAKTRLNHETFDDFFAANIRNYLEYQNSNDDNSGPLTLSESGHFLVSILRNRTILVIFKHLFHHND